MTDTYSRDTWEIYQCEVENVRRIDLKADGDVRDALVLSSGPLCLSLDLLSDLVEIMKHLVGSVIEFSPLDIRFCMCWLDRQKSDVLEENKREKRNLSKI